MSTNRRGGEVKQGAQDIRLIQPSRRVSGRSSGKRLRKALGHWWLSQVIKMELITKSMVEQWHQWVVPAGHTNMTGAASTICMYMHLLGQQGSTCGSVLTCKWSEGREALERLTVSLGLERIGLCEIRFPMNNLGLPCRKGHCIILHDGRFKFLQSAFMLSMFFQGFL